MTCASGELVELAEATVQAVGVAVEWFGPDHRGVLEHVAAVSPEDMASSRAAYELFRSGAELANFSGFEVDRLEMAALPDAAVPTWAAVVEEALDVARVERASPKTTMSRQATMRYVALFLCALWGKDPLPINVIHRGTHALMTRSPESMPWWSW